ncbi:MAG: divergent polysaccharide deacetylase family protein [Desulfatibacillum sp.]|nr:divergent polysaccharide deacetylase family protein [Desulfatibacillum sp.]
MAQKKNPEKKTPPKKGASKKAPKQKSKDGKGILIRLAVAIVLVLVAAGAVAFMANKYVPKLDEARKLVPPKAVAQAPKPKVVPPIPPKKAPVKKPVFEVFPDEKHIEEIPDHEIAEPIPPVDPTDQRPRVAIIIDDMGYSNGIQHKFLDIPYVLTYSVLPHSPDQVEIADLAHEKGREVLLHLPMEPLEYPKVDSGPGTLLASMTTDTMMDVLNEDLASVPHVVGVNNHMGSRLTMESGALYPIFTVLKKRNLFFVDSRTTQHTVCRPSARLFQLPFAQRDVFLDHVRTQAFVEKQLNLLVKIAQKRGQAIGIGHPYSATYEVLIARLPEINEKVKLVPVSELARVIR